MTLGGLAVAVGRVVDDAIVVLENIYRHRAMGEDRLTAVDQRPEGGRRRDHRGAPLTTVGVFLPLGFVGGLVSQFFLPFALTVTFALLASLVCALTVVPVLAYLLIDKVTLERRRGRRAHGTRSGSAPTRRRSRSRCATAGRSSASSACRVALFVADAARSSRSCRPQFINAGSEKILQVVVAPPAGATSEAVLDQAIAGRGDPPRRPQRRARPDEHPGRGRHGLPDHHRRLERPARQLRQDHGPPRRHVDLTATRPTSPTRSRRSRPTATTSTSPRPPASRSNNLNVIVSGRRPRRRRQRPPTPSSRRWPTTRPAQPQDRPRRRARRRSRSRPIPNKAILVGLTAAQVANEVRGGLVGTDRDPVSCSTRTARPTIVVRVDPRAVTSVETPPRAAGRHGGQGAAGPDRDRRAGRRPGHDHAHRRVARRADHRRDRDDDTGAVSQEVQTEIDDLVAAGQIPAAVDVAARRRHPAAERGVRRPVRLDGRRDPARLRDDGADVQLARHAVHHPVQPAARDDRRVPGAVPHRPARSASAR